MRHPLELVIAVVALGLTLLSANWAVGVAASALTAHEMLGRTAR